MARSRTGRARPTRGARPRLWPGTAPVARDRHRMDRVVARRRHDVAGRPTEAVAARKAAEVAAEPRRVPLGAGVSRGVLRWRRAPARRWRLRRGARQPAVGHAARRHRLASAFAAPIANGRRRCGASSGRRGSTPPRARAMPTATSCSSSARSSSRRPGGRFGLILPSGLATDHGSAGAAAPAVRSLHARHLDRARQQGRHLSHPPQRALHRDGGDHRRPHRRPAVPLGPSGSGRARPLRQRPAPGPGRTSGSACRARDSRRGTRNS